MMYITYAIDTYNIMFSCIMNVFKLTAFLWDSKSIEAAPHVYGKRQITLNNNNKSRPY